MHGQVKGEQKARSEEEVVAKRLKWDGLLASYRASKAETVAIPRKMLDLTAAIIVVNHDVSSVWDSRRKALREVDR